MIHTIYGNIEKLWVCLDLIWMIEHLGSSLVGPAQGFGK